MAHTMKLNNSSGFTLIELAIVLIISAFIMAMFLTGYGVYKNSAAYDLTRTRIAAISSALETYRGQFGEYPCPADPTLPPTSAYYGVAVENCNVCISDTTTIYLDDPPTLPSGLRCRRGGRDANGDGVIDYAVKGIVPFRTLAEDVFYYEAAFRDYQAYDGYGNIFNYAVSQLATDQSTAMGGMISSSIGSIRMINENSIDLSIPPSSTLYVLFSNGENAYGAFTEAGQQINVAECFVSTDGTPITTTAPSFGPSSGISPDKQNCIDFEATYMKALYSPSGDANHFDDIVFYRDYFPQEIWKAAGTSGIFNINLGNVGINTNAPNAKLDVDGIVRVDKFVDTDNGFCDNNDPIPGRDCMDPDLFTNYDPANPRYQCPVGEIAVGIQQNQLICRDLITSPPIYEFTCSAANGGIYMTGITYDVENNTFYPSGCTNTP